MCLSELHELTLNANTCSDIMFNTLHRDGGIGNGVALKVTDKALNATVNLHTNALTHEEHIHWQHLLVFEEYILKNGS